MRIFFIFKRRKHPNAKNDNEIKRMRSDSDSFQKFGSKIFGDGNNRSISPKPILSPKTVKTITLYFEVKIDVTIINYETCYMIKHRFSTKLSSKLKCCKSYKIFKINDDILTFNQ